MLSIRLAWRNLWRNKRRTIITLLALAVNTAVLITTFALMDGYIETAARYATDLITGEAQIHAFEYLEDHSLYKTIDNPDEIIAKAKSHGINASPRVYGYGLLAVGNKSAGVLFEGINPELDKQAFTLHEHLQGDGRFVSNKADKGMVLGKKLAKTLNAKIGSEIIAVVQASDGSLGTDIYTVSGILKTAGEKLDRSTAICHIDDFRELFVMENAVHEIALNSFRGVELEEIEPLLGNTVDGLEFKTWRQLNPSLSEMLEMSDVSVAIMATIFFIVAGLGVMNTMLMATYDRIREFGILKAIGTSPMAIVRDILVEAMMMSVIAICIGFVLGLATSYYLSIHGIDMSGVGGDVTFAGIAFDPIWKAVIHPESFIEPMVMMCVISVLASIYPAVIAARLKPVEAMNHV
jgi:ABC-type lipoprotein release transport system permease subunit